MKNPTSSHRRARPVHLDRTGPTDPGARIGPLADAVEAALPADPDHPPTLVAARGDGDTVEILLRPLDRHPSLVLEGFVAPPSWWCLGVVTNGTARSIITEPAALTEPDPDRYAIHLAHLVARTGDAVRVLRDRRTDGCVRQRATTGADDPAGNDGGLLDDYVRCALGVPTPPAGCSTTTLYAGLWIHRVMNEAALHHLLDAPWDRVAALHPVFALIEGSDQPGLHRWTLDHLPRAGELMADAHPWGRVRAACQTGTGPFTGAPAPLAGWLDDGAFARVVQSSMSPTPDLLADLHHLVRPAVHARLLDTIAAWGLLGDR